MLEECASCPRLAGFLAEVRHQHPGYHARPVLPFGDPRARLLIVGLAPGMHGANRSGRPFTDCPTLFVANHVSYLDIVVLGALLDGTFIAKA